MSWGDFFQGVGTLVAALIGIGGIAWVLKRESHERYIERLDGALADVMRESAARAHELIEYQALPPVGGNGIRVMYRLPPSPGGPSDANLQAAVDIAWMASRKNERAQLKSLAGATYNLKLGLTSWQIGQLGQITGTIRKWRTGEISPTEFVAAMGAVSIGAQRSGEEYDRAIEESRHS